MFSVTGLGIIFWNPAKICLLEYFKHQTLDCNEKKFIINFSVSYILLAKNNFKHSKF